MRISRIFRKYSRVLLLVFMSLLLVVFLVGDVISRAQRSYHAKDIVVGEAFGKPVYVSQTHVAESDFDVAWQFGVRTPLTYIEDPHERNLAMYLLLEETRRAGVRVGRDRISASLQQTPGAAIVLDAIRKRSRRSLNSIYDTIARVSATVVLAHYQRAAATNASLPELERAYRDQRQEARVLISVIDSKAFLPDVPTPTEQELQAHFDEAKDRDTAHTEEALVYGYRVPARIQVEYLTVDPGEILDSVRVREKQVQTFYEDNKHKYMQTVEDRSQFALEDAEPQKIQLSYEEVKEQVREDCRMEKAIREAQALVNTIKQEATRPWATASIGEDNLRQPPPADEIVPFTDLQARFSGEYPVIYKKTELGTERELRREAGFGRASAIIRRQPVMAPTLAFHVEGLATAENEDSIPILRVNEPGPVVLDTRGSDDRDTPPTPYQAFVFRVVRVEPSGPPASLDDVRAEVLQNVKYSTVFELGREQAEALAERARQVGLEQAVAEAEELKAMLGEAAAPATSEPAATQPAPSRYRRMLDPFEVDPFTRQPSLLRNEDLVSVFSPGLHEKVFALTDEAGPNTSAGRRMAVVPLARTLRWVVVELAEIKPVYRGDFQMQRLELEQRAAGSQGWAAYRAWFEPDNILQRAGFVPAAPATEP